VAIPKAPHLGPRDGTPPPGGDRDGPVPPPLGAGPWPLTAVALDVSGACNLACRYCAEAATQPRRAPMSEATLLAAWRLLFPDGRPLPGHSLRLGSGEPLLAFPLLQRLQEIIEAHGGCPAEGRPAVFLTTNGTLAGARVRDWLVASGWHVKLSLDGPASVHDRWRVDRRGRGTQSRVAAAVADLAHRMPARFSVTAVLCRGADPGEVFAAIAGLGARRIELVPVAHLDSGVCPGPAEVASYERFVRGYARRWLDEDVGPPALVRFETAVRRAMGYDLQRLPCGAGRTFLGVGPRGGLYPCFRFIGVEPYRLGDLATGPDSAAAAAFQEDAGRPYEARPSCAECWAAPLCGGPCFACAEMFGPGGAAPVALGCAYARADARRALWLVERLRRRAPERLLAFLPGYRQAFAAFEE
jgi:uncharacterized protein